MSISIYYTARRSLSLTDSEHAQISTIEKNFAVEDQIEEYVKTGIGYNWESFCIYDPNDPTEPDIVFEGATKLPDNSEHAIWNGLQHWCAALTEIRKVISDADWKVHMEDREIQWDADARAYDPSR